MNPIPPDGYRLMKDEEKPDNKNGDLVCGSAHGGKKWVTTHCVGVMEIRDLNRDLNERFTYATKKQNIKVKVRRKRT